MHIDDVIKGVKPVVRTVSIVLDGSIENERLLLEDELVRARQEDERAESADYQMQAPVVAQQLLDLQERAREVEVNFTFQSIGRKAWTDLEAQHPPTPEQLQIAAESDLVLKWNALTFPHAAIAASLVEPQGIDVAKVAELEEKLSAGQWKRLWAACSLANEGAGDVGESEAASAVIRGLRQRSEPPEA